MNSGTGAFVACSGTARADTITRIDAEAQRCSERCLDDHNNFWKANRENSALHAQPDASPKARTKRYSQRIAAHIEHHRIDVLQADQMEAERAIFDLTKAVFEKSAKTIDEIRLQARMPGRLINREKTGGFASTRPYKPP